MMRATLIVLSIAALALGAAVFLELRVREVPLATAAVEPPPPSAAAAPPRPSLVEAASAVMAPEPAADEPVALAPRIAPSAVAQVRAAVEPGVNLCAAEAAARHAGASGQVAVAYRLETRAGRIRVLDTEAALTGFDDDALAACIAQAAGTTDVAAPDGQADGVEQITAFFPVG